VAIADYEYIVAVGSGIMIFDNNPHGIRKTYLVPCHYPDVVCVTQMVLSTDNKYLITVVKMRNGDDHTVHYLIYTLEYIRLEHRSPRLITYKNPSYVVGGGKMEITCVIFSQDSQYIALGTNVPAVGVVIMDHKKGDVFQVIPTNSVPNHITFNPLDPCKLCVTGNNGLFQFWRVTAKSIHLAPVVGLRGHALNYTHHLWVPPFADGLVVAATSSGLLTIVLGGEQKGHNVHAFGQQAVVPHADPANAHKEVRGDEHCIVQLMVRGDVLLALSPYNEVIAFEVRRVQQSKGINTLSPTLGLLKRYRLANIDELFGIDFCVRDSVTSFAVIGMTKQSVFQVEVIGDIDQEVTGGINAAGDAVKDAIAASSQAEWVNIQNEQLIFKFHGGDVHSLSVSARSATLVTSSYTDATVRVWSTTHPSSFRGSWVVESFVDRPQENPFFVDMHPSGLMAICAIEGEVREYAITDEHLEMYRRVNIKGPFTGPTGTAHMVTQPVSIVKYSNGGQFFVVVTGKLAQVFNANVLEYTQSGGKGCFTSINNNFSRTYLN
jgi:WD40 repeat protein